MRRQLSTLYLSLTLLTISIPAQAFVFIFEDGTGCIGSWDGVSKCTFDADVSDTVVLIGDITLDCAGYSITNPGGLTFGVYTDYAASIENCDVSNFQYQIFATGAEVDEDDNIEIRGSRIRRDALSAITPIHIYSEAPLSVRDSSIEDFVGVDTHIPREQASTGVLTFGADVTIDGLSLRGMGVLRSLVLIDARVIDIAHVDSTSREIGAYVDLTSIPSSVVTSLELRDSDFGASAVYGADAVAGVVSVILRQDSDPDPAAFFIDMRNNSVSGFDTNYLFENGYNVSFMNNHSTDGRTCLQAAGTLANFNAGYNHCDSTDRYGTFDTEDHFANVWVYGGTYHQKNDAPQSEYDEYGFTLSLDPAAADAEFSFVGNSLTDYKRYFLLEGRTDDALIALNNIQYAPVNPDLDTGLPAVDYFAVDAEYLEGYYHYNPSDDSFHCLGNYRHYPALGEGIEFPTWDHLGFEVTADCMATQRIPTKIGGRFETGQAYWDNMWGLSLTSDDRWGVPVVTE